MSEKDINIEYICNKTLLDKDDELVPIILEMIQESYRAGLSQSEIDNTMGLIEHNQMLKDQIRKQKEVINKAVLELVNIDGNLSNSQLSDRICNLIDILKEVSE
jgi:hypothetical protein